MRKHGEPSDRTKVLSERDNLVRAIDEVRLDGPGGRGSIESIGELAGVGQHDADLGTETFERERDLGLLRDFTDQLGAVDDALRRLDDGTYGTCVECGEQIDRRRLAALPAAPRCRRCQEHREADLVRDGLVERDPTYRADGWYEVDDREVDEVDDREMDDREVDRSSGATQAAEDAAIHVVRTI
jgi:DnaK suppressor protein